MAEDIKKVPEELSEEELKEIAGGYMENGVWHCDFCGVGFPGYTDLEKTKHKRSCPKSPFRKK